ncbi:MAG TPA: hypothetical protein VIG33_18015 [Pseudobdellovibrionaceae bacterium]|jgi:hypothetical protein
MKKITLMTMISLTLTSMSLAQGTATTKLRKTAPPTYNYDPDTLVGPSPYMVDGFNLGFEYLSVNSLQSDIKNKLTGNLEKGLKEDASKIPKQLGFKMGYKQIPRGGMGFDLNLSILKLEKRPEGTSDLTNVVPAVNFIVAAPKYAYAAVGVNTSIVAGDDNAQHSPHIGYQAGGGIVLQKNFNFEILYSWINQGIESQTALTEERMTSTNARLIYAF